MRKARALRCLLAAALIAGATASDAVAASPFGQPARGARELASQATAQSRSWLLPNGRQVTQIAAGPVQWKDRRGRWQQFDFGLDAVQGGWSGRSGAAAVTLPGSFGTTAGAPAELTLASGVTLRTWFAGSAARAGSERDDAATYAGVADGVNLSARASAAGLSQQIVLGAGAVARPLTQRFALDAPGATATVARSGGLVFAAGGRTLFRVPAPTFADASGAIAPGVAFTLRAVAPGVWDATVAADARWAAAARSIPVVATLTVGQPDDFDAPPTEHCQVTRNNLTSSTYAAACIPSGTFQTAKVGTEYTQTATMWADRFTDHVPLMRFDTLALVPTDRVLSASLRLYRLSSYRPYPSPMEVYLMRKAWSASALTTPAAITSTLSNAFGPPADAKFPARADVGSTSVDFTEIVTEWQRYGLTRGAQGKPNYGFAIVPGDQWDSEYTSEAGCYHWNFSCDLFEIGTTANSTAAQRPVLQVTTLPSAPAGSAVITPEEGELTGRRVQLQAKSIRGSVGSVRFQYIAGSQRTWSDIPLAALRTSEGVALSSQDIPVTGPTGDRRSTMAVWDVSAMPGGEVDGPVHVRAFLDSTTIGDGGFTDEVNFRLDRRGIDGAASEEIGPGAVNLLSGEFTMDEQDVGMKAFLQDLNLSRTYRSRGVSKRTADLFGPQWEASVEADGGEQPYKGVYNYTDVRQEVVERQRLDPTSWNWEAFFETFEFEDLGADIETMEEVYRWEYRYLVVENSDGTKFTFTQTTDPNGRVTGWEPDDTHPGYRIAKTDGSNGINMLTLTDTAGGTATFTSEAAKSPSYRLTSFKQPGSPKALSYEYQTVGTRQRLIRVTAPQPNSYGARSLKFNWTTVTLNDVREAASVPRVSSVEFNDGYTSMTVKQYAYDTKGRLVRVTDPRFSPALTTEYVYDANDRLAEVRPPGEEEWRLAYTQLVGDAGPRLTSVSRDHPDGGTATQTIVYDVPVSGAGAPYDLSLNATRTWGQIDDLPWDAVAIFPADTVPSARSPDYSSATIHYVGLQGREVNVAAPGGAITTTEHDANGNVIRELTAANRAAALRATDSAATAQLLSTRFQYSTDGVDRVAVIEPQTTIRRTNGTTVTGRRITSTHYDQNSPSGGVYHLPTSTWNAIKLPDGTNVDEHEIARNLYDGGGWEARQPTTTIKDPAGRAITARRFLHPTYPIVEESRTPAGSAGGNHPGVQFYQYYGITPSSRVPSSINGACSTWSDSATFPTGFLCLRSEGTAADAVVPRRWHDYGRLGLVTGMWEPRPLPYSSAGARTRSFSYDNAGRIVTKSVGGGTGVAVPTVVYGYNSATGRQTSVTASGRGSIIRAYDSNGRSSAYQDAAGTVTSLKYDLRGRLIRTVESSSGHTATYGYDGRDNLTSVNDSDAGEMTATYDADDRQTREDLSSGIYANFDYDETGRPKSVDWWSQTDCDLEIASCVRAYSHVTARDADGRIVDHVSNGRTHVLRYDSAGRLATEDGTADSTGACQRRTYAYDADSNRTSLVTTTQATGPASCGSGTSTSSSWSYDGADRVTGGSWVYDAFGRTTTAPAADSGGRTALTSAYYVDDAVQQMTLGGRTHAYGRDPLNRISTVTSSGGSAVAVTSTNRYADDGDEPISVSRSDGTVVRNIAGPSGLLTAVKDGTTLTLQLRDVQGSVIATALGNGSTGAKSTYDGFGVLTSATPGVIDFTKGTPANGWLGGHRRTTEFGQTATGAGGPVQMGARVYLPKAGRFLQVDPVDDGSANLYDYTYQDPWNLQDLDGRCVFGAPCPKIAKKAWHAAGRGAKSLANTGKSKFNQGVNLVKGALKKTGVAWAACFGWKLSAATEGRTPSPSEVGRIAAQCSTAGFVFD